MLIIAVALVLRLLAALFAKGYGMHDDHFGPIEQPQSIIDNYSIWENRGTPHGHSIVYPGIHYYLFISMEAAGIEDPQSKMYIVRILHAFYSLLVVIFGYRIIHLISGRDIARKAGLTLALFWLMPFMSVRNLIEMVSIPPMMAGLYYILKKKNSKQIILAGAFFAFAFIFRYQTALVLGGAGFVLLFRREFKAVLLIAAGFLGALFLIQGIVDWMAWGYPFAAIHKYVEYNASHSGDYTSGPWYRFILTSIGALIPPMSLALLFGYFRTWKKYAPIFFGALLFFAFHSYFPNKQERFILPVVPIILMLGIAGWEQFIKDRAKSWKAASRGLWIWFWIFNTALLVIFTFTYSKKTRVEPLYYLSKIEDVRGVYIVEGKAGRFKPPLFYLNKQVPVWKLGDNYLGMEPMNTIADTSGLSANYCIIYGTEEIQSRISDIEQELDADLTRQKEILPSLIDDILYTLNPKHNKNQTAYVYRIKYQ